MHAIKTVDLFKQYKKLAAVDNLNLEVRRGELFSLLGANGAGKTTTIKMLSGLIRPTAGDAFISGYSIIQTPEQAKRRIGVSPRTLNLSVKENLELICGIHGFTKEKTDTRIRELSEKFKLDAVLTKRAGTLSGGWKRRVGIAMALISEPEILFLDEPTLGLDVIAQYDLWALILELKGKVMSFNKQGPFYPISQSNLKMPPLCLSG